MPPLWGFVIVVSTLLHKCRPSGTKEGFEYTKFLAKFRCGCKPHLPDPGINAVLFLKLTFMVGLEMAPTSVGTFVLHNGR